MSPANVRLDWKVIARYSSLFGLSGSDKDEKLKNIDHQAAAMALTVVRIEIQKKGRDQLQQIVGVIGGQGLTE